jgi:hypothetical protein
VIVDEAHGAARPRGDRERGQHQRHELVRALAADQQRHLLLVNATPHRGIEESFRSLLGLLDPGFEQQPPGSVAAERKRLQPHQPIQGSVKRDGNPVGNRTGGAVASSNNLEKIETIRDDGLI